MDVYISLSLRIVSYTLKATLVLSGQRERESVLPREWVPPYAPPGPGCQHRKGHSIAQLDRSVSRRGAHYTTDALSLVYIVHISPRVYKPPWNPP